MRFVAQAYSDDLTPEAGAFGAPIGQTGVYYYEYWQKKLQGQGLRGKVQLEHGFTPGTEWMKRTNAALDEIRRLAPKLVQGGTRQ